MEPPAPRLDAFGVDHEPKVRLEPGEPLGEADEPAGPLRDPRIGRVSWSSKSSLVGSAWARWLIAPSSHLRPLQAGQGPAGRRIASGRREGVRRDVGSSGRDGLGDAG